MDKIKSFWEWFESNQHAFLFTNEAEAAIGEQLLSDLMHQLHEYNDSLYFMIGGKTDADQELIVTAEGDVEQFDSVEELINNAPEIEGWKFIAFTPPSDEDNTINYEGAEITRSELWFLPLQSASNPTTIGIKVCVPDYMSGEKKWLDNSVYKMLDTVLGEKSFALDIGYLDIGELPDDPKKAGMIELAELPAFIRWKKKKIQGN